MTLSRLGCRPLWRDYFDPSFSSLMPAILAWFPSFVLWVILDLCRYRNTKRVMLTKFAGMQELRRQVESVSSQSKVSVLYSVSCRAYLSERSILKLHCASLPKMSFYAEGDVTRRDDSQRRFQAQHGVAMLEQCCCHSKQCCTNVATLCCAKNCRCKSSSVTGATQGWNVGTILQPFKTM